jgi:hypothetical protein
VLLRKRENKEKKGVSGTSNNESKVTQRKSYSLYEDPKRFPNKFFWYFRMWTASFDQLLVLLGPSLTFQDTRMRKTVPLEERLAVTLR